jgi:hypothetical protein
MESVPLKVRMKEGFPLSPLLFNILILKRKGTCSEQFFVWDSIVRKDNQKKHHLKHNSERTSLEMPISGSFLYWNPASNVEQNVTSVFLMFSMPCVHHTGG